MNNRALFLTLIMFGQSVLAFSQYGFINKQVVINRLSGNEQIFEKIQFSEKKITLLKKTMADNERAYTAKFDEFNSRSDTRVVLSFFLGI